MKKFSHYLLKILFFLLLLSPFCYSVFETFFKKTKNYVPHISLQETVLEEGFRMINAHEHIESLAKATDYLEVARKNSIVGTLLLGSPKASFDDLARGFEGEEENNEVALKILETYPDEFIVFPTLDPRDVQKMEKLKSYVARGAKGLKLYSGNRRFHELKLDDATMLPVYRFCQENNLPILFHVNTGYYLKEFENVLKLYPDLKIICPHFCLSTIASDRFEYLMDTYLQLYTDISFGDMIYLEDALRRISKDPQKYRRLVDKYQDRVLFGTDMMVSSASFKTKKWMESVIQSYRDMLEKDVYTFFAVPNEDFKGLALNQEILEKIYFLNFQRFFEKGKDA